MRRRRGELPIDGATGGVRSRGRQLLLRVLQQHTRTAIADRVGVDKSTVSRLASGVLVTRDYHLRIDLEEAYGIPAASWDEPPMLHACNPT